MFFDKRLIFSAQRILLFLCVWKDHWLMWLLRWQWYAGEQRLHLAIIIFNSEFRNQIISTTSSFCLQTFIKPKVKPFCGPVWHLFFLISGSTFMFYIWTWQSSFFQDEASKFFKIPQCLLCTCDINVKLTGTAEIPVRMLF